MAPRKKTEKQSAATEKNIFEKIAERYPEKRTEVDIGDGVTVQVWNRLRFSDMIQIIQLIVTACVNEERGEVRPELFDYAFKSAVCSAFCDIPLPENHDLIYEAVVGDGRLFDTIQKYIDGDQLYEIETRAWDMINMKQDLFNSAAAKLVVEMTKRVNELFDVIGNVADSVNSAEITEALEKLGIGDVSAT